MSAIPAAAGAPCLPQSPQDLTRLGNTELFRLPRAHVEDLQRRAIGEAFTRLRPQVAVLDKLAADTGVNAVEDFDDLVPLLFPHTMLKSYPLSFIEKKQYRQLTAWLDKYTTHDLSKADIGGADSLDSWLDRLEAQTPIRPACSSGTSGKVSFVLRSLVERPFQVLGLTRTLEPWREERGVDLSDPEQVPHFLTTWPTAGRFSAAGFISMLWGTCYHRHPERIHARGDAVSTDMLYYVGRMRSAEAQGKTGDIGLPPGLRERLIEGQKKQADCGEAAEPCGCRPSRVTGAVGGPARRRA